MAIVSPIDEGRFGPYGGRYVPETLMFALRQLSEHYEQARGDPEFQKQFDYYMKQYVGRPCPLYFAERLTKEAGGAASFSSAKISITPAPQDQQQHRPGAADAAHGQAAHHRRDRRRPARRGHRDRGGALWPQMPGLHGRGGRPPAKAQRLQNESARAPTSSRSPAAAARSATPSTKRCATGWRPSSTRTTSSAAWSARIRFRRWSAIFNRSSAPKRAAVPGAGGPLAGCRHRLRRRRQQFGGHVLSLRRRYVGEARRRRGRRPRHRRRRSCRHAQLRQARRFARLV